MSAPLPKQAVVGVIGAGAMGAGIAQVAAAAGHPVKLLDNRPQAAERAVAGIRAQFAKMAEKGKMSPEAAAVASKRLMAVDELAALADASLVIEAIVENLQAKQKLYSDLEEFVGADCIFGTNPSSISVTSIGAALQHPERLAGLHFFNPAPLMALVEIVSGLATDPATIDACCREAGGFRMGPFELMDMIGHDVNFAVTRSVWDAFYNDQRFLPSLIQQELVDAGFLGKKVGRGFYDYREGAVRPAPKTEAAQVAPDTVVIYGDSAAAKALAERLRANKISFSQSGANGELIAKAGDARVYVTDGRTATRRAFETGIANTVLIDLALDYNKATRLAISVAAQCDTASAARAIGLQQAAGMAVSRFNDVPGLAVMRTVAMLANEAADAVNQGVSDAKEADSAMRLGVNYPSGPLAWADTVELPKISQVLTNPGQAHGEDRYRVSPLIQHKVFAEKNFHD